ncbi:hypothetical protein UA08_04946 [Talaromyces atroroseus]|uniref:Uncharacterized protein n=1 Tax=Talaromyces atroroseus TaxID=1441469 RepID=A0A225AFG6_TALAT|nr:hypothetical protein UA08_04946 [Talaromyces atroroseus]OKL60072.1 hypothetical protein UA08_04946 [Talaromyces atroroseus]
MAHQPDKLPWNMLIQNLEYYSLNHSVQPPASNLYLALRPDQSKDITTFAKTFSQTLSEHISLEREKYPRTYDPPDEDDLIVDDATARRISPAIAKRTWFFHTDPKLDSENLLNTQPCHHSTDENTRYGYDDYVPGDSNYSDGFKFNCKCALPLRERKRHAFLRKYRPNECYGFYHVNKAAFFNLDVVKTLFMHGEMDPVLRVCSHPNVGYGLWQDSQFQEDREDQQRKDDHRNTKVYQEMLHRCTKNFGCPISNFPHQRFFGITDEHFGEEFYITRYAAEGWPVLANAIVACNFRASFKARPRNEEFWEIVFSSDRRIDGFMFPFGAIPFDVFLNHLHNEAPYLLHEKEVTEVCHLLCSWTRLPYELILLIMEFAGYSEQRRLLPVAHDPLNLQNGEELEKYLEECWGILVRCGMFAEALGDPIDWEDEVKHRLTWMFKRPKMQTLSM